MFQGEIISFWKVRKRNGLVIKSDSALCLQVTMFHWDIPQYLQDLGGFANSVTITYFEAYAKVLFDNFGDRVSNLFPENDLPATLLRK